MRIPSGKIDQWIFFVAVDATDLKTRKTGLSAFSVVRSRQGVAQSFYTTPTIVECDSANMPGIYRLLIDEDTTIASTSDNEEQCLHITCATMAPVTRVIELYRRDTTSGQTLTVTAGGIASSNVLYVNGVAAGTTTAQLGVNVVNAGGVAWNSGAITASTFAAGAITAAKFAANALDAVWSTATRLLTAGTNIVLAKGVGVTGFNDLDAPGVRAAVGLASANLDAQLATFATAANLTVVNNNVLATYNRIGAPVGATISADIAAVKGDTASIKSKTDSLPAGYTLNDIANAVFDQTDGIESGYTLRQTMRLVASATVGKARGLETSLAYFRDLNDTKDRIAANVDDFGNRLGVTKDVS